MTSQWDPKNLKSGCRRLFGTLILKREGQTKDGKVDKGELGQGRMEKVFGCTGMRDPRRNFFHFRF